MASGASGLIAQRAVWFGIALACSACGGRSSSSAAGGSAPTEGSETGAETPPAPGAAGRGAHDAGGNDGPAVGPVVRGGSPSLGPSPPADEGEGGSGGEPHSVPTCAELARPLRAELLWQDVYPFYGSSDYPFLGFAPDGSELVVPIDEGAYRDGNRSYAVRGGELLVQPPPAILDRDAAWSRQILAQTTAGVHAGDVAAVADGRVLAKVATDTDPPLQLRLSSDGQYVFRLICEDGLRIERLRLTDGEASNILLGSAESLCLGGGYGHPRFVLPLSASRTNGMVLVAAERRGFAIADFESGTASFSVPADAASIADAREPNAPAARDALSLALSPSEHTLATVDMSGTLRLLTLPDLTPSAPDMATAVTSAFVNGYVTPRSLAPVAWSPDERYLASADAAGATVVRRACDGSIVVTLPAPLPAVDRPDDDPHWTPAFLAFNPRGLALAVLRVNPRFRATLSYYQLSP